MVKLRVEVARVGFDGTQLRRLNMAAKPEYRGVSRTSHITDGETFKEELENLPEIAISFWASPSCQKNDSETISYHRQSGCVSHFYHFIVDAALPLYAKFVEPFLQEGRMPPRRTVYVNAVGGVIGMLGEVFPQLKFVFVPWVPQCCASRCVLQNYSGQVPLFVLRTVRRSNTCGELTKYRQLVLDFRDHILERAPGGRNPLKHVFISRREDKEFYNLPWTNGGRKRSMSGCARRCLNETVERRLIQAMNDTAAGVQVWNLQGMQFSSQVQLHRGASVVVGLHGAAFVNCLWMPRKSSIIEIRVHTSEWTLHFQRLCKDIVGLHWHPFQGSGPARDLIVDVPRFMSKYRGILR